MINAEVYFYIFGEKIQLYSNRFLIICFTKNKIDNLVDQ